MNKISVQITSTGNSSNQAKVVVEGPFETTTHMVEIKHEYAKKLGYENKVKELVHASFDFLLEHEPNTSILRAFELSEIHSYFPAYEETIRT